MGAENLLHLVFCIEKKSNKKFVVNKTSNLLSILKARSYPKWHAPLWDVGLLGGSKSKISSLCSKNDAAQAPTPFLDHKMTIHHFVVGVPL